MIVSPSRGDAPEALDAEWVPIRPNTDAALMLGMAHTLLSEGLHDADFVARCCNGFETYADYVLRRRPGPHAGMGGRRLRRAGGHHPPAGARGGGCRTLLTCAWSLQRSHRGEQPYWGSVALAALLGQIGCPAAASPSGTAR